MAYVTLPGAAVIRMVGSQVFDTTLPVPFNLPVGDDPVWITVTHGAKNGFAVKIWGAGTGASLKMMTDPTRGGVGAFAEGTRDIGAPVDL